MNRGHYGASYDLKVGFGEGYESEPETGMDGVVRASVTSVFEALVWFNDSVCDANRQVL